MVVARPQRREEDGGDESRAVRDRERGYEEDIWDEYLVDDQEGLGERLAVGHHGLHLGLGMKSGLSAALYEWGGSVSSYQG